MGDLSDDDKMVLARVQAQNFMGCSFEEARCCYCDQPFDTTTLSGLRDIRYAGRHVDGHVKVAHKGCGDIRDWK